MSLRVRDLLDNPALGTRLLAGKTGLDRTVAWAHSCEVAKPWEWMGSDELLMTTGRNFPADATGQVDFLRNLHAANIAAVALAEGMDAPALTAEAAAEAEANGFPVLQTAYEIPFVLLSRTVADATTRASQLTRILRVYDRYRQASQLDASETELLAELGKEVSADLAIVDLRTSHVNVSTVSRLPHEVRAAVARLADQSQLPAITRVPTDDGVCLILPIEGRGFALLAMVTTGAFDLVVLQHVTAIASVLAARSTAAVEARLSTGGRLFTQLAEGRLDSELAWDRLQELELAPGPWQVLAVQASHPMDLGLVHRVLMDSDINALLSSASDELSMLVRADQCSAVLPKLQAVAPGGCFVGVSEEANAVAYLPDAARQAHWALEAARIEAKPTAYYGVDRPLFLPRTVAEAQEAVTLVLGPLIDYDQEHGTDLLTSLQTFFAARRSWQEASKKLMVHKQTLVYRMRRVEELTGRQLDDLDDISELHLALKVRNLLNRL